jgi:hypothetical protein
VVKEKCLYTQDVEIYKIDLENNQIRNQNPTTYCDICKYMELNEEDDHVILEKGDTRIKW